MNSIISSTCSSSDEGSEHGSEEELEQFQSMKGPFTEEDNTDEVCSNKDSYESDTDSEADLDLQIDFLRRKGALLERACQVMREEAEYSATVAREECVQPEESPLWSEAKEVLRVLYRGEAGPDLLKDDHNSTCNSKKRKGVQFLGDEDADCPGPPKERKSPKHPRIDLTSVKLISKGEPESLKPKKITMDLGEYSQCENNRTSLEIKGKEQEENNRWMTGLLRQTHLFSTHFNGTDDDMPGSMNLMQATSLCSSPRLVMNSHPPFHVVHANRAFSVLSGIAGNDVIGKSIESILKRSKSIKNSTKPEAGCCDSYFDTVLDCSASDPTRDVMNRSWIPQRVGKPCLAHLVPVVDRSKCSRLNPNQDSLISHLLLQLEERGEQSLETSSRSSGEASINPEGVASPSCSTRGSQGTLSPPPPLSRRMELIG